MYLLLFSAELRHQCRYVPAFWVKFVQGPHPALAAAQLVEQV
jgi:hypothetical protein